MVDWPPFVNVVGAVLMVVEASVVMVDGAGVVIVCAPVIMVVGAVLGM